MTAVTTSADHEAVIGVVASFRKEKAYDVVLDARAEFVASNPKIRFVSIGQGPLEAEIREQHERLRLGERFLILGCCEDATRVMSAFDVFTLSSHHEGLPVALVEALAINLPVVATAVGASPTALADATAIVVPPGDASALVSTQEEMIENPSDSSKPHPQFEAAHSRRRLGDLFVRQAK